MKFNGSAPHTQGTVALQQRAQSLRRFSPAHAGNGIAKLEGK